MGGTTPFQNIVTIGSTKDSLAIAHRGLAREISDKPISSKLPKITQNVDVYTANLVHKVISDFDSYDKDHDGQLSKEEVASTINKLQPPIKLRRVPLS